MLTVLTDQDRAEEFGALARWYMEHNGTVPSVYQAALLAAHYANKYLNTQDAIETAREAREWM